MTGPWWWTEDMDDEYVRQRTDREPIVPESETYGPSQRDYQTRCADVEAALTAARERVEEWDHHADAHGWWHERPHWIALYNEVLRLRAQTARPAPKREPQIVEREAAIVEAMHGGALPAPDIARVVFSRQQVTRSEIVRVAQSLRVLERDGIVRRVPLLTGMRHWELV